MHTDPVVTNESNSSSNAKFIGILIAAASLLAVLMMAHHPSVTSQDIAEVAAEIARKASIDRLVHGVLIALICALLFAFGDFSRRLGLHASVRAALLAYAIGTGAMIGAALLSGFVAADIGTHYAGLGADQLHGMRDTLFLCLRANQACANLGVVARCVAVLLWSIAILRRGGQFAVGMAGLLLGSVPTTALLVGMLHLDVHGMMLALMCEVAWNLVIAIQLVRGKL